MTLSDLLSGDILGIYIISGRIYFKCSGYELWHHLALGENNIPRRGRARTLDDLKEMLVAPYHINITGIKVVLHDDNTATVTLSDGYEFTVGKGGFNLPQY